jgi:hypothetical protein
LGQLSFVDGVTRLSSTPNVVSSKESHVAAGVAISQALRGVHGGSAVATILEIVSPSSG